MARSQESFNKKEVRAKKEKKREENAAKRLDKKENTSKGGMDDMIAYVDENGMLTSTPPDPNKKRVVKAENIEISIQKRDDSQIMDPIRKGILTFYNDTKGFGFIKDSETHESIFVHVNNILEDLKVGNIVNFEVEMGQKGPTAVKVKIFK